MNFSSWELFIQWTFHPSLVYIYIYICLTPDPSFDKCFVAKTPVLYFTKNIYTHTHTYIYICMYVYQFLICERMYLSIKTISSNEFFNSWNVFVHVFYAVHFHVWAYWRDTIEWIPSCQKADNWYWKVYWWSTNYLSLKYLKKRLFIYNTKKLYARKFHGLYVV